MKADIYFQSRVADFVEQFSLDAGAEVRLMDLLAELGELAKEVLSGNQYGKSPFSVPSSWEDEMGDVFFSLICLANVTGVDLEQSLDKALVKYQIRREQKRQIGSGE
jgi:NTP pyrophosphatase (non-canonical NTP hydrolase)